MGVHMKFNLLQMKSARWFMGALLVLAFVLVSINTAQAQYDRPGIPRLSLTGNDQWDTDWYPDGRIWLPPAANGPREFLMPVFVDNRWAPYEVTRNIYQPAPIKSFRFTLMYNFTAVRPVSVELSWPLKDERLGYLPLANKFNISWYDRQDYSYGSYFEANPNFDLYSKGRAMTIVGTSTEALPNTDLQGDEFKVLLYVRFRVIPEEGVPMGNAQFTPIYIKNDTIMWNDLNVRKDAPFKLLRPEYKGRDVTTDYPDPTANTGLAGVDNQVHAVRWNGGWRMLPGTIYLRYSDNVPEFGWQLQRGIGSIPPIAELSPELWDLKDPITVDSGSTTPLVGTRRFQLLNKVTSSRLLDVFAESDQPWLEFRTVPGPSNKNPWPTPHRYGYVNWIDNGILGDLAFGTPVPSINSDFDGNMIIEIRCNPANLNADNSNQPWPEKTGIYVGYITFRSSTAAINPVKLRVTFIYFRTPFEVNNNFGQLRAPGIHVDLYNSARDSVKIIFGTGHRASDGVDTLFGEYAYDFDMTSFSARWFPPKGSQVDRDGLVPFGFGDFAPDDDNNDGSPKRSNSRDIRDIRDTNESIIYYCKIREDNPANYPIVLEWDIGDFPEGSQLFLKDAVNGFYFPDVDMRKATGLGQTRRSFTIQDARVKEFIIEYTLPRVIDYVDEYGAPIIKKGWNLLSLPVRPVNREHKIVYPNSVNIPYFFSQNQYQDERTLRAGVGYFIKYGDAIDTKFAGTFISTIKVNGTPNDSIRVYPGWNTIGNLTKTINVTGVAFSPFGLNLPGQAFTRAAGVWRYVTDRGYVEVSEMRPGLGYWIKVNNNGFLSLDANLGKVSLEGFENPRQIALNNSVKLQIRDNSQNSSAVYFGNKNLDESMFELPPAPPVELFDVRFNQGTKLTVADNAVIRLQGVEYPVAMTIENADATYNFYDAATGNYLGQIVKGTSNSIEFEGAAAIKVQKAESQFFVTNYPNPVNGMTAVNFAVPSNEFVTVKIYNNLGMEIATVVNGFLNAGEYTEMFDAAMLASGSYIIKITAGNNTAIQTMTVVK